MGQNISDSFRTTDLSNQMYSGMRWQVVIYDSLMTIKAYWLLKVKRVSPKPAVSKGNASTEMKYLLVKPCNGVFDFYNIGLMLFFLLC